MKSIFIEYLILMVKMLAYCWQDLSLLFYFSHHCFFSYFPAFNHTIMVFLKISQIKCFILADFDFDCICDSIFYRYSSKLELKSLHAIFFFQASLHYRDFQIFVNEVFVVLGQGLQMSKQSQKWEMNNCLMNVMDGSKLV